MHKAQSHTWQSPQYVIWHFKNFLMTEDVDVSAQILDCHMVISKSLLPF